MEDVRVQDFSIEEFRSSAAELKFPCCYCNETMHDPSSEAQVVIVFPSPHTKDHLEQVWYCHMSCFAAALHPDFRAFRSEWHEFLEERNAGLQ